MTAPEGFEELYRASRERLAAQVYALTGDAEGALDLVQEAFVRTWERWDRVSGYEDPEAFVRRVAFNLAKSRWRRLRRTLAGAAADPARDDPDVAAHRDLVAALLELSTREREVIVLHYLAGQAVDEIAAELKVPSGTVKSWLSRGRGRLAERLAVQVPEEMTHHG